VKVTYEEFAQARLATLARYAVMLTGDRHSAEDLVQETMVRAQLHWRKISKADAPERYVKRMMVNIFIDWQRGSWWKRVIERDAMVAIPGHGKDKINAALFYGMQNGGGAADGLALAERTVSRLSGVEFDGGAVVEYPALRSITDIPGGMALAGGGILPRKVKDSAVPPQFSAR
jgi:Sigma-70 region 2/LytR_cpsA_psr family